MKKILVAVTGGISAYKALDVISGLKKSGFYVSVMQTENSKHFVTRAALENIADKYWVEDWNSPVHIKATDDIDAFVLVPATANTIAKIAHGIGDNLVTDSILALPKNCIKIFCPAMNSRMLDNPVVIDNRSIMYEYGWKVIDSVVGKLACGTTGMGKLPPTRDIVSKIIEIMG